MAGYFPRESETNTCNRRGGKSTAVYEDFTAWHVDRGAEIVFGARVRFKNAKILDCATAGIEMVSVTGPLSDEGPGEASYFRADLYKYY